MSEIISGQASIELREAIDSLRNVKTHIRKTRTRGGVYWHARSLGEPRMDEDNPLEGPTRVRLVEAWLGDERRIGRVKIVVQHIFQGDSLFSDLEDDEENGHADTELIQSPSGNLLQMEKVKKELEDGTVIEMRPDIAVGILYRLKFRSNGTMSGTIGRVVSEENPYIVGLDNSVSVDDLYNFGHAIRPVAREFKEEPISEYLAGDLSFVLNNFAALESVRISQREEAGRIYYD